MKPRLRRATALKTLGRLQEAVEEYRRVLGLDPRCNEAKEGLRECKQALENASKEKEQGNIR